MRRFYQVPIATILFTLIFVSIILGWSEPVWGNYYLTLYGTVAFIRAILQSRFAYKNNRQMQRLNRKPIVDELSRMYPAQAESLENLLDMYLPIDKFRRKCDEILPPEGEDFWDAWYAAEAASVGPVSYGTVHPVYRVRPEEIRALFESLAKQTVKPKVAVFVLNEAGDDDTWNLLGELIDEFSNTSIIFKRIVVGNPTLFVRLMQGMPGKRHAMWAGFGYLLGESEISYVNELGEDVVYPITDPLEEPVEYVLHADSDTELDLGWAAAHIRVFQQMPSVHMVTGDVDVVNFAKNLLTRVTQLRYWIAFNKERAAQSHFNKVTCASGPNMSFRAETMRPYLARWAGQIYLGRRQEFGDDRHWTTLLLMDGYDIVYTPDSITITDVPFDINVWKRQQTRWSRSFWRETFISAGHYLRGKMPSWVAFDVLYQLFFPLLLYMIIASLAARVFFIWSDGVGMLLSEPVFNQRIDIAANIGLEALIVVLPYIVVTLLVVFFFHSLYGWFLTGNIWFFIFPLYIYYTFNHLQLLRVVALFTLRNTGWGTRTAADLQQLLEETPVLSD